jgi:hypothetical protein
MKEQGKKARPKLCGIKASGRHEPDVWVSSNSQTRFIRLVVGHGVGGPGPGAINNPRSSVASPEPRLKHPGMPIFR